MPQEPLSKDQIDEIVKKFSTNEAEAQKLRASLSSVSVARQRLIVKVLKDRAARSRVVEKRTKKPAKEE